jgi:Grx4 family monothiol glutaredoxin
MVVVIESEAQLNEMLRSGNRVVLHIGAAWCAPCAAVNAQLDQSPVDALKLYVDAERLPDVAERFDVDAVPSVLFLRPSPQQRAAGGSAPPESGGPAVEPAFVVAAVTGAKPRNIEFHLDSLFGAKAKSASPTLDAHLAYLIGRNRVVAFITGSTTHPRCGFTSKLVQLFDEIGLTDRYTYVDIMEDDEVCQHLKKYSDWPTYPQVYVAGDLVGGLDICAQMHAKGQLVPLLKTAGAL